ncbi:hypothetical protein J437_LFUL017900 [Ladona fulva]|uniref:Carboxylesterase type B domain-containing protein n=1 Tax=Ladona fulva TaxID=123851 RepID=A0A8K0KKH9_LADFU|nr:hypothetical protein J437_LFUL017900 [Ladona fulva]
MHSKKNDSFFYAFNYRGQNTLWDMIGVSSAPFDGGVCHANDLLMLFNIPMYFLNDEEKEVSQKMVSLWTNFAKYGEPNPKENMVKGVPKWPPYDNEGEYYMRFDKEFKAHRDFKKEFTIAIDEANEKIKG